MGRHVEHLSTFAVAAVRFMGHIKVHCCVKLGTMRWRVLIGSDEAVFSHRLAGQGPARQPISIKRRSRRLHSRPH